MNLGVSITIGVVLYMACLIALASVVCQVRPEPPHWPSPLEAHMAMMARSLEQLAVKIGTALQPAVEATTEAMRRFAAAWSQPESP